MCKSSREAKRLVDVKPGMAIELSRGPFGGLFHPKGVHPTECLVCIQSGTIVTIENVPKTVQATFNIGPTLVAEFKQTRDHGDDVFLLDKPRWFRFRRKIRLNLLAGATLYVGMRPVDRSPVVEQLLKEALVGAATAQAQPTSMVTRQDEQV